MKLSWIAVACALAYPSIALGQTNAPDAPALVPPKLVENVDPTYPEAKRASGEAASVALTLTIDRAGQVTDVAVAESAGPEFDEAAVNAARNLRFEPAQKNGEAIPAKIRYVFEFKLAPPSEPAPAPPPAPVAAVAAPAVASSSPNPPTAAQAAEDEALDVEVQGEKPPREPTKHVIAAEEISRIPGTNGDAIRAIGNMPGVARPPGGDGMLIVRGSSPNDTAVFVDGTDIPMVYHFGGLSSVIPTEMLEKLDFYPGNFGPQYGRAMGGVVDVGVRSPRKDKLGGLLQFDLVDGRLLVEGPISKSTRFMLAGRRSWLDAWLGAALKDSGVGVTKAPVYYDYQAMVEHDFSRQTTLRLFAFGADDRFKLMINSPSSNDPAIGGDASQTSSFGRLQARVETRPSSNARISAQLSAGREGQHVTIGGLGFDLGLNSIGGRADARIQVSPALTAIAGLDFQYLSYDVTWKAPPNDFDSTQNTGPLFGRPMVELKGKGDVFRPAAYAMLELTPVAGFKLFPGVRADYNTDTRGWTIDPRIGVRYDLHPGFPRTTLKGGVGLYHQPPQPYQSIEPFGTKGVGSPSAVHTSLGIEQEISRPLEFSIEGFYKDLNNLVVPVAAADQSTNGQSYQNIGSGRIYGSEFLLRYKPEGRFFGWIAYTLSRSERRDADNGAMYIYDYDQTHILTALGSYKLGRGWQAGARFRYISGTPYTPVLGGVMDYDAGTYAPINSGNLNSGRTGAFHQLDLRIDKTWTFSAWKLSAYLDVQNTYLHQNPEGVSYNYNYSQSSALTGIPFLPIIGLRGEL
ncbi:MAG TPA: TonB family protein [Polyangiaceae bacterium]|nr:TonB family protein [Polyangiaceae bacterium]